VDNLMYVKVRTLVLLNIVALLNPIKEDIIIPHVGDAFKLVLPPFNEWLTALHIL